MQDLRPQRALPRFRYDLPLIVKTPSEKVFDARTRDVSACGIFFYSEHPIDEGSTIELTLDLPKGTKVRCFARVVRVEQISESRIGIAVETSEFDFLPTAAGHA